MGQAQKTLRQLIEEGIQEYPSIKAREAETGSALRDSRAARTEYIPKVTAQHQFTYATSNSLAGAFYPNPAVISPSGGIRPDNINQATWGSYTSGILEWNVFNFGRVSSNVRAFDKGSDAAMANQQLEVFRHKLKISDAYLLTLMYEKLAHLQEVNLQRAEIFAGAVNAGVKSGMRPGVDSSLATAELAKSKLQLLQAQRERQVQHLRLQELTGTLEEGDYAIDSMAFFNTVPPLLDTTSTNTVVNPLIIYHRLRFETAQSRTIATRRSFLPSITLVGAAWARGSGISPVDDSFNSDFSAGTTYQVHNYLLGVSTRWTISDLASNRQRYRSDYFRSVRDQQVLREAEIVTSRQLNESAVQYRVSQEEVITAPIQLTAAQSAYQQASARYRSGLTDLPTLMQSMLTLNRAETDLAISYINLWRSLLAIAAAKGDFSIFMNVSGQ